MSTTISSTETQTASCIASEEAATRRRELAQQLLDRGYSTPESLRRGSPTSRKETGAARPASTASTSGFDSAGRQATSEQHDEDVAPRHPVCREIRSHLQGTHTTACPQTISLVAPSAEPNRRTVDGKEAA